MNQKRLNGKFGEEANYLWLTFHVDNNKENFSIVSFSIHSWQCGGKINEDNLSINCSNCLAPQLNEQNRNYFILFDQLVTYDVDVYQIRQKYLNLQRILHPDKFTNRPKVSI